MKTYGLRMGMLAAVIGLLALSGAAGLARGQDYNQAYREYQRAQMRVQRECTYRAYSHDCRQAQADLLRWQSAMQRSSNYNNGYYNNGYNNTYSRTYRVYSNGGYYNTDSRGYELLRQAVNRGYQQGYRQGQIDRTYGRGFNYYGNSVYMSGMYGYESYVGRDQYQYYFQQGFQKGYEDGFNNTSRYGYRTGSGYNILGNILGSILNLATQP